MGRPVKRPIVPTLRSQGQAPALAVESLDWLIDQDMRVKLHEPVQPRGITLRHIHTAMRAMNGVLRAAQIEVGKVRTGAVLSAPPTVVKEVAVAMVLHRIVNRRRRIPIR